MEDIGKCRISSPILITGGAGFIGSHLVDKIMDLESNIVVLDNLGYGSEKNLSKWLNHPRLKFAEVDLLDTEGVSKAIKDCVTVFHLAANPEVRIGESEPDIHFRNNILATYNLLEALRKSNTFRLLIFTSSSTVYGDALTIPTQENHILEPISIYGASKMASESLISAYAHTYGFRSVIFRLANVIGPRTKHGVIYDFIRKLRENPSELEIMGDGTQAKSYVYIEDCINALFLGAERLNNIIEIFNIGSEDQVDVKTIARIVIDELKLENIVYKLSGGIDGGRGWKGDVKYMLLDTNKIKKLGWRPRLSSTEAVKMTVRSLVKEVC